ncbi:MAG TPA: alpha-amylase family glycosyl hydrolase, partial [Bacteroidota bacterium]
MRIQIVVLFLILYISNLAYAQGPVVDRVEPPNWWVGMRQDTLQLMIEGRDLRDITVSSSSAGVSIVRVVSSPKYAFVDILLEKNLDSGRIDLNLKNDRTSTAISYPIYRREKHTGRYQGFSPADVIYLITPDRFANGDITNDSVVGMSEGMEREEPYGRHGGDIQGVIDHLDYLKDLGVTALWLNPVVENNGKFSYHGYAVTDMYRIDPRFGTNELYRELVSEAHRRGLKIIMDHVSNHIGINHRWVQSLPMPDWLNGSAENHLPAYHGKLELTDIHADSSASIRLRNGWFSDSMPDLNQRNSFVAKYITQNSIWWIETTGLDGIREDTYPYVDPGFASRWARAIRAEYPQFSIVGEVWIQDP